MATIKEIAALAGVSRGTVDRVLNNRGSVNPETESKIKEIAERLNYQPNKAGMMLAAQKKSFKIGILLFSDSTLFFNEILDGINAKKNEFTGYNLSTEVLMVPFAEKAQLSAIDELVTKDIHALIIAPYNSPAICKKIDALVDQGIPVITVNTDIRSKRLAYVGSNFYHSGVTAAGLAGRMTSGPVSVGIILGSLHILCHTERVSGFSDRIKKAYPRIRVTAMAENNDDDVESYKQVSAMLTEHPEINCLFFTAGGVSGGCRAVEDFLAAHPDRDALSIFAYDNISTTVDYVKKGVITAIICQQQFNQGYQAFDLITRYLFENVAPENEHHYLDIEIKISENL